MLQRLEFSGTRFLLPFIEDRVAGATSSYLHGYINKHVYVCLGFEICSSKSCHLSSSNHCFYVKTNTFFVSIRSAACLLVCNTFLILIFRTFHVLLSFYLLITAFTHIL